MKESIYLTCEEFMNKAAEVGGKINSDMIEKGNDIYAINSEMLSRANFVAKLMKELFGKDSE